MTARLTTASYLVLGLVEMLEPTSPYELKQFAATTVTNFWTLPHTQIYAQCDKLVEAGLLAQEQEEHGRRRRILTITDAGRKELAEWRATVEYGEIEAHDLGLLKLFLGTPAEQLAPEMLRGHKAALARYETHRSLLSSLPPHLVQCLEAGIAYRTSQIGFWTQVARDAGLTVDDEA